MNHEDLYEALANRYEAFLTRIEALEARQANDAHEILEAKLELDSTIRQGAVMAKDLADSMKLLRETAKREAADAAKFTARETDAAIRNVAAEAVRGGVGEGAKAAIKEVFGPELRTMTNEATELATQLGKVVRNRRKLNIEEIGHRFASWLVAFLAFGMILMCAALVYWKAIGKPYFDTHSESMKLAEQVNLAWPRMDKDTQTKIHTAFDDAIADIDAKNAKISDESNKAIAADKLRKAAAEAKAAADEAEENSILRAKSLAAQKAANKSVPSSVPATSGK